MVVNGEALTNADAPLFRRKSALVLFSALLRVKNKTFFVLVNLRVYRLWIDSAPFLFQNRQYWSVVLLNSLIERLKP